MEELQKRIKENTPLSVLYFDLNNFKSFNDLYGFFRGDEAIKKTAEVLSKIIGKKKEYKGFVGHVGGDDFVCLLNNYNVESICEEIIKEFDKTILDLYDEEDRKRGMITSTNRKGEKVNIPIMGLAIAVVTNQNKKFTHPGEIALIASDLKKSVKSEGRSAFLIDRRS